MYTRRRAFSLVELSVVVSILGILSSVAVVNYIGVRRTARDSVRATNARAILDAITTRQRQTGTAQVQVDGKPCVVQAPNGATTTPGTGAGCTGMSGFGSGLVNASSTRFGTTPIGDPQPGHVYAPTSIADALIAGGYLRQQPIDPNNKELSSARNQDFAIIYCGTDNFQSITPRTSEISSVFFSKETALSREDIQNNFYKCGAIEPVADYAFDLGSYADQFQRNVVIYSNGSVQNVCTVN